MRISLFLFLSRRGPSRRIQEKTVGDTSPCLPHGPYTSNTLRVSQLTPSQTFHFVVQRARHSAHDGSHKWKPSPVGSDATVCFSFPRWAVERWDARGQQDSRPRREQRVGRGLLVSGRSLSIFARIPSGLHQILPSRSLRFAKLVNVLYILYILPSGSFCHMNS